MEFSGLCDYEPWTWLPVAALILVSALFTAIESALFSLGPVELNKLADRKKKSAAIIDELLDRPRRLILTLVLGNEIANLAAVILIIWIMAVCGKDRGWPLDGTFMGPLLPGVVLSLVLVLVAGQTLPKLIGSRARIPVSRGLSYPLWIFMKIAWPVRALLKTGVDLPLRALGVSLDQNGEDTLLGDDIKGLVEEGTRHGILDVTERELLTNLIQASEITAEEILTPRHEIVSVPAKASSSEVKELMDKEDYSRLPVYEGDPDRFVGVVTEKDMVSLKIGERAGKAQSVKDVMRPPLMVPESRKLRDLLLDFRKRRSHLALVVDEFGAVTGLVTMEDVLEEIFGEVREQEEEEEFENLGEDHWLVAGRLEIEDFNTRTGARLKSHGTRTISGLVLSKLGRRPRPGDRITAMGFSFKVVEVRGIIINRLEVKREAGK